MIFYNHSHNTRNEKKGCKYPSKQSMCIPFIQRRPNVFDVGPALYECYTTVLCLLGYLYGIQHKDPCRPVSGEMGSRPAIPDPDTVTQSLVPTTSHVRYIIINNIISSDDSGHHIHLTL